MYAVIETGGKQYKVEENMIISIERIQGEPGDTVTFPKVMAIGDGNGFITVDPKELEKTSVKAEILEHYRGDKLIVFKMKRRKSYRRKYGHRQELTKVKIISVCGNGEEMPQEDSKENTTDTTDTNVSTESTE